MVFSLIRSPTVLKDASLKVTEVPDWQTRGRDDVGSIKGVMCHHMVGAKTGKMPSLRVLTDRHSTLSGPLSQLGLVRDGILLMVAAGGANHTDQGKWKGIITGNSSFIGIGLRDCGVIMTDMQIKRG